MVFITKAIGTVASSTNVGVLSTAASPVWTPSTGSYAGTGGTIFDTARRLQFWSTGDDSVILSIVGTREGGAPLVETIQGASANGVQVFTTQDFVSVSTVTASSAPLNAPLYFGTSSLAGTPWQVVDVAREPVNLSFQLVVSTTRSSVSGILEYTVGDVTFPTPLSVGGTSLAYPWPITSTTFSALYSGASINNVITGWRVTIVSTVPSSAGAYITANSAQAGVW